MLGSDIPSREILRAVVRGAVGTTRIFWGFWLGLMGVGLVVGAVHPLGVLAELLITPPAFAFATLLGLAVSLRCRSSLQALGITLAVLVMLNGGYFLALLQLGVRSDLALFGIAPTMQGMTLISYLDANSLFEFHFEHETLTALAALLNLLAYSAGAGVLALVLRRSRVRP